MDTPRLPAAAARTRSPAPAPAPALALALALAPAALALGACAEDSPRAREIPASSARPTDGRHLAWDASSAERFGYEPARHEGPSGPIAWSTPPGWRELPSSSLRLANFQVAGDPRAECYLTVLSGDGGGLLANVNRWRKQMSLREITAKDLEDAPRVPMLETEAVLVDFEGTWTGMAGDQSGAGYRLIGLLAVDASSARFLKMTGPAEVLEAERDAFLALAASFGQGQASPAAAGPGVPGSGSGGFSWSAPPAWRQAPARAMREVTFLVGAEDDPAECYVAVLGGNGGGALPNINRWRDQMGQPDLSQDEFEQLTTIAMLGTEAPVVEVEGTYRGMGDELVEQGYLLGAVCELPDRAVFVKMVGPEATVRAAREEFLSFCQSLE